MNISAVMIVKNAEDTIAKTLDSLKAFDDVIVYDTGSSDTTLKIAQAYENVVIHLSYFAGFSESKNRAAELAKNDWILSIDADEVVSPELLETLKQIEPKEKTVYKIKRNNYYRNRIIKYSGWGNEYVIRLYNRNQTQFNSKLVHEHIDYREMCVKTIKGYLRHYSYHSISNFVIKRDLYSTLFAEENRGKRKSSPLMAWLKGGFDFFNTFFIKRGFLDGYRGLLISISNADVTFYKYLKLYEVNVSNYKKICSIVYCNNECNSINVTINSILRQSLPPDEIFVCIEKDNKLTDKDIHSIKNNSFVPISFVRTKQNESPYECINKIIKNIDDWFIVITYGNGALLTNKFIAINANKTKPGFFTTTSSLELQNKLYRRFSKKKRIITYSGFTSLLKCFVQGISNLYKHKIHSTELPYSIAFYRGDYNSKLNKSSNYLSLNQKISNILIDNNIHEKKIKHPRLQYNAISNKKKVLICLDRLKLLNCGLGQVSLNFGREILKNKPENCDIVFMLPQKGFKEFEEKANYIKLNLFRSLFARYMRNYDLCHIPHQLPSYNFGRSKKNVLTIHDLNFIFTKSLYKSNRYLKNVQRNINKSDTIVFISDFTKGMAYKYLDIPDTKKVEVIYNGVTVPEKSQKRPKWLPSKKFLFSIGQFLEKKNFHVLLPFIKQFSNDYILIIAGENKTSYGDRLKNEVNEMGIQNKVIFPGGISEEEKGYLFHNCSAFLFPSIAEGFGLPIIEAMLCSKPVFCSDRTSLREIGREFAFFWTNFDTKYMLKIFETGMEQIKNSNHIENQKKYAESYTYSKNVEEYLKIYKSLL